MRLTRRDAAIALGTLGVAGGVGLGVAWRDRGDADARTLAVMVAAADVLYPTEVTGVPDFVEAFVGPRLSRPEHGEALRETVDELDRRAERWYGEPFDELPVETRDSVLHEVGAATAAEDPDGTTAERVRYYVVNELLMGLYASPTGGELLGLENPPGHPGGIESYAGGP